MRFQRMRVFHATAELAGEGWGEPTTVGDVIARAGVSRRTFYELFRDFDHCLLEAFDEVVVAAAAIAGAAYGAEDEWVDRLRAGLQALLAFFDREPSLARLCIVRSGAGGASLLARRSEVIAQLAAVVEGGRAVAPADCKPPELTGEALAGAVLTILHARLLRKRTVCLVELLPEIMSLIVLPYMGSAAARTELTRSHPPRGTKRSTRLNHKYPLGGAFNVRVTYRTVRVLREIARHPSASNREIADRAGVTDQGQISKLLNRLARLDLIRNIGEGQKKGRSNAWLITSAGASFLATSGVGSEVVWSPP